MIRAMMQTAMPKIFLTESFSLKKNKPINAPAITDALLVSGNKNSEGISLASIVENCCNK